MYLNSFEKEEYLAVTEEYSSMQNAFKNEEFRNRMWQSKEQEEIDEYIIRQRKCELNDLVNKVIDNELSPSDRLMLKLHWYQGYSKSEIARRLCIEPSTVSRRLEKITDIIYDKLKYALEYRYGSAYLSKAKLIIKNKNAFFSYSEPESLSARIRQMRMKQGFELRDVSKMTGITEKALKETEEKGRELTAGEIRRLSLFYGTTADYIIFGSDAPPSRKGCCN